MKCLCNPAYTHAQSEKLIDAGTLIYVNMVIVHRLISILCFFGHSHSSIDNSYELFMCCTCYDNLSNKKIRRVSYSTQKHHPSHENSGYLGGADGLIDGE